MHVHNTVSKTTLCDKIGLFPYLIWCEMLLRWIVYYYKRKYIRIHYNWKLTDYDIAHSTF